MGRQGNARQRQPLPRVRQLEPYREQSLKSMISRFFGGSTFSLVSTLTRNEEISADELRELIDMIEKNK